MKTTVLIATKVFARTNQDIESLVKHGARFVGRVG